MLNWHVEIRAGRPVALRRCWPPPRWAVTVTVAVLLACACTPRPRNVALESWDPNAGYRFNSLEPGEGNGDETFVVLAFSGGGTRAAALAYGVLLGLDEQRIDGRTLLDEVDMISSVSGGSFTAMAFGLWGRKVFDGRFEERFLRRNVQRDLILHVFNPLNFFSLPLPILDSIDVAATYYDKAIFDRATYGDLLTRGRRPFIEVNATDMARRQAFGFTQAEFDLLGSDLSQLSVAWAVAASSAFPVVLTPIRLHYFPGEPMRQAIQHALEASYEYPFTRRRDWARSLCLEPDAPEIVINRDDRRYLYLLDGGLADNLGLHAFIRAYRSGAIRERIEAGKIKRLLVVIVDAETRTSSDYERNVLAPGRIAALLTTLYSGVHNSSKMSAALVHYMLGEMNEGPGGAPKNFESHVVDVNFMKIRDRSLLREFMSMVTSFVLPQEDIDGLIELGRKQIAEDPAIRRMVRALGGS